VDADLLNLPRGVKVVRITPAQVTLELERVARKSVPVHLRLDGKPPAGLQVADTKVAPDTVQVSGPASDVENVQAANTEPLDIRGVGAGTFERELALAPSSEYLAFSANKVAVQVRVEDVMVTREFKQVQLTVRNASLPPVVRPDRLRIVVRGPKRLVDNLELGNGAAYVDAEGRGRGNHVMKPTVDVPAGVQVVAVEPAKVRLTLRKGK
jgi:YbbR domain-containing protein